MCVFTPLLPLSAALTLVQVGHPGLCSQSGVEQLARVGSPWPLCLTTGRGRGLSRGGVRAGQDTGTVDPSDPRHEMRMGGAVVLLRTRGICVSFQRCGSPAPLEASRPSTCCPGRPLGIQPARLKWDFIPPGISRDQCPNEHTCLGHPYATKISSPPPSPEVPRPASFNFCLLTALNQAYSPGAPGGGSRPRPSAGQESKGSPGWGTGVQSKQATFQACVLSPGPSSSPPPALTMLFHQRC